MTELLEKAFAEAAKLTAEEQDFLAEMILEELSASDEAWDASFAKSKELLRRMADKALKDYQEGRTEPLDPDTL